MKKIILSFCLIALCNMPAAFSAELASNVRYADTRTIVSDQNLYRDFAPRNADGTVNAIIEIPAGDNEKWEVGKDGIMRWDIKDGKPRVVAYTAYPANYGMIPRTSGGDGDSIDVVVLGSAVPRGTWLQVRIIGALKLLDGGEVDDKLIAVIPNGTFGNCHTVADLNKHYPGSTQILETWFANYKGPGKMQTLGFAETKEAESILETAIKGYQAN